jgi:hypothetical protein
MEIRKIIDTYYELANKGKWNEWCDLFSSDVIINEQLAGAIEGLSTLKSMMQGMDKGYSHFANIPKHIILELKIVRSITWLIFMIQNLSNLCLINFSNPFKTA